MRPASELAGAREESYRKARLVAVRAWAAVGCVVVFLVALRAMGEVSDALECLTVAIVVGFAASPVTNWLERRGVGRALGALLGLVLVLACCSALLLLVGPIFLDQLRQLLERVPALFSQTRDLVQGLWLAYGNEATAPIQSNIDDVLRALADMGTRIAGDLATSLSSGLVPNVMAFANGLVMFFLGLVMAYWFAKDYPVIFRELGVIAGPAHGEDLALMIAVVSRSMGGYIRGIVVTSLVNGLLALVGFAVIGHPYAGLMGIITGVMHFVPVVGPALSAVLATLTALFVGPGVAFWSLIVAVVAQNVTDNLLSPLVMRSAVKIHPAMSLIGITVGAGLGGALGMAMAVPLTAAIKGVFVYFFEARTGRQLVSYDGAFFRGTPFHREDGTPAPSFDALDDSNFLAQTRIVTLESVPDALADEPPASARRTVADQIMRQVRGRAPADKRRDARRRPRG